MITFLTPLSAIVAVSVFHLLRKRFSTVKSCLMSVVLSFIIAILIFIVVMINVPALEKIFPSLDSLHGQTIKIPEINFATTTRATTSPVSPDNN
jgi:glucan phosphoethanolaminetransferase (alkaline phosphatase superfamily)